MQARPPVRTRLPAVKVDTWRIINEGELSLSVMRQKISGFYLFRLYVLNLWKITSLEQGCFFCLLIIAETNFRAHTYVSLFWGNRRMKGKMDATLVVFPGSKRPRAERLYGEWRIEGKRVVPVVACEMRKGGRLAEVDRLKFINFGLGHV